MGRNQGPRRLVVAGGAEVAARVATAVTPWRRLVGLLGRRELAPGEGLAITPCRSIHMFFMRFPLDVAFVDREWTVVRLYHGIRPWRMTRTVRRAHTAIELPAGTLAATGVSIGDTLHFA